MKLRSRMESPVVFVLILAMITFTTDHVCSQSIYASKNPLPVGSDVTLYSHANVTTGVWLYNNDIIVMILPTGSIISNTWHVRVMFNSTTSALTIKSLQLVDSGVYTLQAVNSFRGQLTLSVQEPISNVTLTAKATSLVEFNDSAVLMCSVSNGSSLSYIWLEGKNAVTPGREEQLSNRNATLTIVNVTRNDEGPFKCNVSNGISSYVSPPLYLNISYGPSNTSMMIMPMMLNYTYRTGSNITLSCSTESSPPAMIKWMVNGVYLNKNGQKIHLENVTESDSGMYKCVFYNTVTLRLSSASVMVWILDPLEAVEVNRTSGPAILHELFSLNCHVTGTVDRIQWWKNWQLIFHDNTTTLDRNNKTLILNPVQHSDTGDYICQAFNSVSNMTSRPYKVEVNYGPEKPTITGPTVAKTGSNVTFSCHASSKPPSLYNWYFKDYPVGNTSEYVTPPLTKNMSGTYTCEAYNIITGLNKTAYTMLTVVDPIENVHVEPPMSLPKDGEPYTLMCNVSGPADRVYWMKNGIKLYGDNEHDFHMDNKTIAFNLTRNDTGYYTCMAMNAVGNMTSPPYKLLVNFGPDTPVINGPRFAETGRTATFNCSAMSVPPSHFSWWFNGTEVANTSTFTTDLLSLNMSGEYTCMAYNYVMEMNSTSSTMLTVIEAIESVMLKNDTIPINLENLTLTCDVTGPYDKIYWMKNNVRLNTSEHNMLNFTPVTMYDDGTYQCVATNEAAQHESPPYVLLVNYGPLHVNITGPDSGKTGASVMLKCSADSRPGCDFFWFFNNKSSTVLETGSVFTFISSKNKSGTYICKARNPVTNIVMYKTKAFTVKDHASASPSPSRSGLMLMGVFALFVPVLIS